MSDMIQAGRAWLNGQLKQFASQVLTYQRGDLSVQIAMTIGGAPSPLYSLLASSPSAIDLLLQNPQNAVRSFTFDAADLDFGSGPVLPAEGGDQILEVIGGITYVFTVMPPMSGLLAWDYVGQHRMPGVRLIVHTQPTGVAS